MSEGKVCTRCKQWKVVDEFYVKKDGRLGRASACVACTLEKNRTYRAEHVDKYRAFEREREIRDHEKRAAARRAYLEAHREEDRLRAKRNYEANKETRLEYSRAAHAANREQNNVRSRAYRRLHRDRIRIKSAEYYRSRRDYFLDQSRHYRMTHRDRRADAQRRRRAWKRGARRNDLTVQQWTDILNYFNHCCAYCLRGDVKLTMEHLTPLSRGGDHTVENVVPACGRCNRAKWTKTPMELLLTGNPVPVY